MRLKDGVRVHGLRPEMVIVLLAAYEVFEATLGVELVVTSAIDGKHSRGSLHYVGQALDLRIRHMTEGEPEKAAVALRARLGKDYDVILESNHIHVEFQPKDAY